METVNSTQNKKWQWCDLQRCGAGLITVVCFLLFTGCAQVPKQSVELSATVGRDIAQVYKSHRDLAVILYSRIKSDINKFIDEVYAPYQIKKLLQAEHEDFESGRPDSLFAVLDSAIKRPDNPVAQINAVDFMEVFVQVVREEVEAYRKERLAPVLAQEKEVLSAIDRSYNQIHYANSIVTGHLASVVNVHDAQEKLLNEFGLEGLHKEIGQQLANTSNMVADFVGHAKKVDGTISEMEKLIGELTEELDNVVKGVKNNDK